MTDRPCPECGHPITQNQCWRLTCTTNGGSGLAMKLALDDAVLHGIGIMKDGKKIDLRDFYVQPEEEERLI